MPLELTAAKRGKHGQGKAPIAVQISAVDADLCRQKWSYSLMKNGLLYVHNHQQGEQHQQQQYLSRLVMERILKRDLLHGEQVNFIDGNPLNCQRDNLRLASHAQVLAHRGSQKNNTSGYKGVFWLKDEQTWKAEITAHGVTHSIGRFADKHAAARAYNAAALRYHGAFAMQNSIEQQEEKQQEEKQHE